MVKENKSGSAADKRKRGQPRKCFNSSMAKKEKSRILETPFSSPICKWSLPLLARKDGGFFPSGTAIIIAERLAITAKHVIEDFMCRLGTKEIASNHFKHEFYLQASQLIENGESAVLWNVCKIWRSAHTDIAFLLLEPTVAESLEFEWKKVSMDLRPLEVGTKINAFGYPTPTISFERSEDTRLIYWRQSPSTSSGIVTQVYHERRDTCFLKFPCYETNAAFKPSMSGGPVFTKDGFLCGLVCSGIDFGEEDADPVSYIVALWPSMATPIKINRKGHPKEITYPVLELAKDNFIYAEGWENIEIGNNPNTGRVRVSYKI